MIKLVLTLNGGKLFALFGLGGLLLLGQANANECLQALPAGSSADGHPRLCQSDFSGSRQHYACQDYRADGQRYRVLYRGGLTPKAILQHQSGSGYQPLELSTASQKATCPLPVPAGIPSQARHLGTGVCHDQSDKPVPCSLYKHTAARQVNSYRYIVFYKTNYRGQQQTHINARFADNNRNAMAAELAYQIGLSLKRTDCCADQATAYLAFAHQLYPNARVYLDAYQLSLAVAENP